MVNPFHVFSPLLRENSLPPASAWGSFHRTQLSMNFSSASPSHQQQFSTNCSNMDHFSTGCSPLGTGCSNMSPPWSHKSFQETCSSMGFLPMRSQPPLRHLPALAWAPPGAPGGSLHSHWPPGAAGAPQPVEESQLQCQEHLLPLLLHWPLSEELFHEGTFWQLFTEAIPVDSPATKAWPHKSNTPAIPTFEISGKFSSFRGILKQSPLFLGLFQYLYCQYSPFTTERWIVQQIGFWAVVQKIPEWTPQFITHYLMRPYPSHQGNRGLERYRQQISASLTPG